MRTLITRGMFSAMVRAHVWPGKKVRPPKMVQPDNLRRDYTYRLRKYLLTDLLEVSRLKLLPELEDVAALPSATADSEHFNADQESKMARVKRALNDASAFIAARWSVKTITEAIGRVPEQVEKFSASQLNKTLRAYIGVDVVGGESWLAERQKVFIRDNVKLIKSISEKHFDDLEKFLVDEVSKGARFEKFAEILESRYGVTERRAELIARDQVGKYNGELNAERQLALGIEKFIWETSNDERVRDEHADRQGKTYEYSNPPDGELPGEPVQCRCYAAPDLSDLI